MKHKLILELNKYINKEKQVFFPRFFKTGKDEYGEGDIFLGITVPNCRVVAKKFSKIDLHELKTLIHHKHHEVRLCTLLILVEKYANEIDKREKIYTFYLDNLNGINNWDLVDLSAPKIVGEYLKNKSKKEKEILYTFAKSSNLWEKRIAIVSTYTFIRNNDFEYTIHISEILLKDKEDLIHKAVGWMLREMGKRDVKVLESFLEKHSKIMPRTMLRYSIEKFDEEKRKYWLKIK